MADAPHMRKHAPHQPRSFGLNATSFNLHMRCTLSQGNCQPLLYHSMAILCHAMVMAIPYHAMAYPLVCPDRMPSMYDEWRIWCQSRHLPARVVGVMTNKGVTANTGWAPTWYHHNDTCTLGGIPSPRPAPPAAMLPPDMPPPVQVCVVGLQHLQKRPNRHCGQPRQRRCRAQPVIQLVALVWLWLLHAPGLDLHKRQTGQKKLCACCWTAHMPRSQFADV